MIDNAVKKQRLYVTAILLVSVAVYFNTLFNGFVFDDEFQVVKNPWIRDWGSLTRVFTTGVWNFQGVTSNYYRPIMHVIYLLTYQVFGLTPWGFHLVNILFHAGASVMAFFIAERVFGADNSRKPPALRPSLEMILYPPFVAGILFAVNPVHTEAVAWVAGLPDLSCTFFFLLSLYLYIRDDATGIRNRVLSVAAFAVSLLCKEVALVLPAFLLAYDFIFKQSSPSRHGVRKMKGYLPYISVAAAYLALRTYALGGLAPVTEAYWSTAGRELGAYEFFINIFPLFAQYLGVLILPVNLNAWREFQPVTTLLSGDALLALLVTAGFLAALYFSARKNTLVFFGLFFILVPLLPALYIKGIGGKPFAERYLYLPSFGFAILLALLIHSILSGRRRRTVLTAVALAALTGLYAAGTITRNAVWRDDLTFWTETARQSPAVGDVQYNLATVFKSLRKFDRALPLYQAAIATSRNPKVLSAAYDNVGNIYQDAGKIDNAIEQYRLSIMQGTPNFLAHNNLGTALSEKGLVDDAIREFQAAVKLAPQYPDAYYNLGITYMDKGLRDEAIRYLQEAVRLAPTDQGYRHDLQKAVEMKGS